MRIDVIHVNMDKDKENAHLSNDLVVGDHVRVRKADFFKKGNEPRWTDETTQFN